MHLNIKLSGRVKAFASVIVFLSVLGSSPSHALVAGCPDVGAYPFNGCDLPGIQPGGFPYFTGGVRVTVNNKKDSDGELFNSSSFNLHAPRLEDGVSTLTMSPTLSYDILKTTVRSQQIKVRDGVVEKGLVRIRGAIPELGIDRRETLFEASFVGNDWAVNTDGDLFGFETDITFCNEAITCTAGEVTYINLEEGMDFSSENLFRTEGIAVSTIPVPAAVWLFGSGLLGLMAVARRKRVSSRG